MTSYLRRGDDEIFLLYQNDAVLGVFSNMQLAEDAAAAVRAENPCEAGEEWRGKSPRWFQNGGRIMRLEIERRDVTRAFGSAPRPSAAPTCRSTLSARDVAIGLRERSLNDQTQPEASRRIWRAQLAALRALPHDATELTVLLRGLAQVPLERRRRDAGGLRARWRRLQQRAFAAPHDGADPRPRRAESSRQSLFDE